jgi:methylphosphotriester-DNA--protein-cysteine methyltransferase
MGQKTSPGPTSPPRAFSRAFTTPEAYAAFNGLGGIRVNGTVPRDFRASQAYLEVDGVRVRNGEATIGLNLSGSVSASHVFTFGTKPAPPRLMLGREVGGPVLFHPRPNELLTTRSPTGAPFPWACVTASFETLAQAGTRLAGRAVAPPMNDVAMVRASGPSFARLLRLVNDAARVAASAPEIADSPQAAKALAGVLLETLVDCLSGSPYEYDRAAVRRHGTIMSRFDAVLREGGQAALGLADLCGKVGTSQRTLHEVCLAFVGMSPMQYARRHRLDLARDALLAADPAKESVTAVALRHGFWQYDRFFTAYRQAYGETPRATLRRDFARASDTDRPNG